MCTMPRSDNPILKLKPTVFIQECFYLFKKKKKITFITGFATCTTQKELKWTISNICAVSPEILSFAGARQVLAHNLNFSPLQFGLRYFLHHKFSEQTDQLERCLAFLKTAEPKPLTMNTLNSREGRRTYSTAWQPAKRFFFLPLQQQEDRSLGWTDAEVQEATAERATLIKTFQQSAPQKKKKKEGLSLSVDLFGSVASTFSTSHTNSYSAEL